MEGRTVSWPMLGTGPLVDPLRSPTRLNEGVTILETSTTLTPAQTRAVLNELRTRFPDREDLRYAAVVLDLEEPNPQHIRLLTVVINAAIDAKAIHVAPSAIVTMDESVIALIWLVNPASTPEMLEVLQKKMSANCSRGAPVRNGSAGRQGATKEGTTTCNVSGYGTG
jgi:hypothetical protein